MTYKYGFTQLLVDDFGACCIERGDRGTPHLLGAQGHVIIDAAYHLFSTVAHVGAALPANPVVAG